MSLQSIENGRRVSLGKDVKAMVDADAAFHHHIYATSGNPLIAEGDWARAGELSDVQRSEHASVITMSMPSPPTSVD